MSKIILFATLFDNLLQISNHFDYACNFHCTLSSNHCKISIREFNICDWCSLSLYLNVVNIINL